MKRINSLEDDMRDVVTYDIGDGQFVRFDGRAFRELGLAEMLRRAGLEEHMPTERLPVIQGGRRIGTMAPDFDPMTSKPTSFFYDMRPGDFRLQDGQWIAEPMLGPGDIAAVPGFIFDDPEMQRQTRKYAEEDREVLRKAIFGNG